MELQRDNSITEEITPLYLKNYCFNYDSEKQLTLLELFQTTIIILKSKF